MGKLLKKLGTRQIKFIRKQKLFFVATAMSDGRISLSPKGMDTFRVLNNTKVLWLNLTGSGNETATHLKYHDRMTLMFCAFEGDPTILRLYGKAKAYHKRDSFWDKHIDLFPAIPGGRQLIALDIQSVQTSCGFGVPFMEYKGERNLLDSWAEEQGPEGLLTYMQKKNTISLDGHSSGVLE